MISYEEFLRTAAVPRETLDRFLAADEPTWAERATQLTGRVHDLVSYLSGPARLTPRTGLSTSKILAGRHDGSEFG